ncbi:tellurite resistance/C4-dicarboxylate transporter family protein [Aequorivita capsosiphonis]|uniref:tellurite resistance/C4-dicarboxylate transporter family protein n=1 Tax=Aequorivita capsosiphonis TaxID=487317 RepID=UPI0004214985|nr:tellurite resistance/C4-dicarboxylate transporter family protein [Aequorivita capsosiphonis]
MKFSFAKNKSQTTPDDSRVKSNPFHETIAFFPPGYFSLVMATGIVSIAAHFFEYQIFAKTTLYINLVSFIILSAILIIRLLFFKREVINDFYKNNRNMGFLSIPAACCIMGSQFVLIVTNDSVGIFFFVIGLISWVFLIYTLFAIIIEEAHKPSLKGVNGSWLLIIVSTQSLFVLSVLLVDNFPKEINTILFFSFILFLCGCMFYIIIITLVFYRLIFLKVKADQLKANYWISMGADAISVLAGSMLIQNAEKSSFLPDVLSFLKGFTSLFWAIGTWWIPLIIVLGIWRHIVKKIPLKYTFQYWTLVFPLGMYAVCTLKLSQIIGLSLLNGIGSVFVIIAIASWTIVFLSMLYAMIKYFLRTL